MDRFKMDPIMMQKIEMTLNDNAVNNLDNQSGTDIYELWSVAENRRFTSILASSELEETVLNTIERHNTYYETTYKRSDFIVIKRSDDPVIELQKAKYRTVINVRALDDYAKKNEQLEKKVKKLSDFVKICCDQSPEQISRNTVDRFMKLLSNKAWMNPNLKMMTNISKNEIESIIEPFVKPFK